ncbi:MAG: redoxin domain-containing protein [Pikeienuella sp.]
MTTLTRRALLVAAAALGLALPAAAAPEPNAPAPLFTATDTAGQTVDLEGLKGRTVILEWTNHDCPFVIKHYGSGNMQAIQRDATAGGAVWISIISSAPGKQGHVSAARADELTIARNATPSHVVLDPEGTIGKMYRAVTTPQMFVIDAAGQIVFMGGIDDKPTANPADIPTATNYVRAALEAIAAGTSPAVQSARPYGCAVRYAS